MMIFGSILTGIVLGIFYFGGLWITVKRFTEDARHPRGLILISFLLRTLFVLLGFYLVMQLTEGWQAPALTLAGFIAGRMAVTKIAVLKPKERNITDKSIT